MKDCFEMSPLCLTGGFPPLPPVREYPTMNYMGMPYNWQYHHQMYQSQTASTSERRDSGVHSIADSNGSSPSSDDSDMRIPSSPYTHYCPPPRHLEHTTSTQNTSDSNSAPIYVKEEPIFDSEKSNHTPAPAGAPAEMNALQNLQQSVERNLNISSSVKKENDCDNNNDVYNHEDYSVPSLNSHGKIKTIKCKQCQVVFNTKIEFWTHQRQHIKPERLLQCEKCPFVTEYKHHLEYHMRNHGGEKPFRCKECDYKCVNKSMLNSHMKSHSTVYQYRCSDCSYTTKYCHSLKLHLRKYNHNPAMVLNPDGTPNPLPIIDVYGTRRGPKARSTSGEEESEMYSPKRMKQDVASPINQMPSPVLPGVINPLFMAADPEMQMKLMFQQALLMHMMNQQNQGLLNNNNLTKPPTVSPESEEDSVLDLSREKSSDEKSNSQSSSEDEDEERLNLLYKVKVEHAVSDAAEGPGGPTPPVEDTRSSTPSDALRCPHCCITFDDIALFTIHMRFHNFSDPFTCNSCGEKCDNKIEFTVHIFSKPH